MLQPGTSSPELSLLRCINLIGDSTLWTSFLISISIFLTSWCLSASSISISTGIDTHVCFVSDIASKRFQ